MTSQMPKISGDCRKIKLLNFSILRYSSICATHTRLRFNFLFETAFYSLFIKPLPITFNVKIWRWCGYGIVVEDRSSWKKIQWSCWQCSN